MIKELKIIQCLDEKKTHKYADLFKPVVNMPLIYCWSLPTFFAKNNLNLLYLTKLLYTVYFLYTYDPFMTH